LWYPIINCGRVTIRLGLYMYNADHRKGRKHHHHPNMLICTISPKCC
jgi:hypothetical protein